MNTAVAIPNDIPTMIAEYEEKRAELPKVISVFERSVQLVRNKTTISGTYVGDVFGRYSPRLDIADAERILLQSAWKCAYKALYIDVIASAKDRDRLTNLLEKPPEFTSEKLQEHFGTYVFDVRFHILKGLAEAFCGLSDEFKSHSKVRVGKKGQVKRIILKYVMTQYGYMHGYGSERFFDVLNALNVFEGKPHMTGEERLKISEACHKEGEAEYNGLKIKVFANGNAHVHFTEEKMNNINRALAEFYGDILPDAESEEPTKQQSTAVSKDLQYYPTPVSIAERMICDHYIKPGDKVLEPSCGDGRIMDAIIKAQPEADLLGIEYHGGRANDARAKGHHVVVANFLEKEPTGDYDFVFMNPPFSGKHYLKHIEHAKKFLRPGGHLVAILPASAWYDHMIIEKGKYSNPWTDLPIASFRESGTCVNTGIYRYRKP